MDSVSQIVLGAAVGEAVLGRKVGNKAPLWSALLGTVPDLDIIPGMFMDPLQYMFFHRGFSHSIAFCVLAAPIFGWLIHKIHKKESATWREWTTLAFLALFTHPILDCFTSWGTQLFWPHEHRVAWNTIFIVDPLYTVPFLITVAWLMFYKRDSAMRRKLNYAGLIISCSYLLITVVNKNIADNAFENALAKQEIEYRRFTSKPTPLNSILWFAVVESQKGYHLGYYSLLDKNKDVQFHYIEKNHRLLQELKSDETLQRLLYIAKGYYVVEEDSSRLLLHDLRFGQVTDFNTGKGDFVFTYFLEKAGSGELRITQKPRNTDDIKKEMFSALWNRLKGI